MASGTVLVATVREVTASERASWRLRLVLASALVTLESCAAMLAVALISAERLAEELENSLRSPLVTLESCEARLSLVLTCAERLAEELAAELEKSLSSPPRSARSCIRINPT